eukprot:scaffold244512_cov25-Prasinocladus_malaysianus.AAC.1
MTHQASHHTIVHVNSSNDRLWHGPCFTVCRYEYYRHYGIILSGGRKFLSRLIPQSEGLGAQKNTSV